MLLHLHQYCVYCYIDYSGLAEDVHYYNLHTAVDVDIHIVVDCTAEVFVVDNKQAVAVEYLSFHQIVTADTDCTLVDFQADYIQSVVAEASYYNFEHKKFVVDIVHLSVNNMAADRH